MLFPPDVQVHDSNKNVKVVVTGVINPDDGDVRFEILRLDDLVGKPKGLRLDSIVWLIEEKAGLRLYWGEYLIFPMESRNSVRFDTPLNSPQKDWTRNIIGRVSKVESTPKAFFLLLDMDKQ